MNSRRPIVLKFGGAALEADELVADRVHEARRNHTPVVVVVSAREGVTDLLQSVLDRPRDSPAHRTVLRALDKIHPSMPLSGKRVAARLRRLVAEVEHAQPLGEPLIDRVLSMGERLAVHWLSSRLNNQGLRSVALEADQLGVITDNAYGHSLILLRESGRKLRPIVSRILASGRIPVITGFFGRSLEGRVAVLGRGGSDYSASAIGAILGARRVELIKRTASLRSADPQLVPRTRPIVRLSYEEAEELAQFGAQVLHPLALEPARARHVELWVRSLSDPTSITVIGPALRQSGIRAVTLLTPLRLLRVRVPGGRQRPGIVAELTRHLALAGINVVSLFTSSAILSLVVRPQDVRQGLESLRPIADGAAIIEGPIPVGLVTAIGDGILDDMGRLPNRVLSAAEGFSATPRSLALAVPSSGARQSLIAVHKALVEATAP